MARDLSGVTADITAALAGFEGTILGPGDGDYDQARTLFNAMIDRRPAVIARCASVADVQKAVNAARNTGVALAVRGGGHNVAGNALCDGGLVIDLTGLRKVTVDPVRRRAWAEGGATWADFDAATQAHGLATTGGAVSSTGIAGLTLGGGIGWLMRKHGLACDNLASVDLVTAAGTVVRASTGEHPELFWGLRGGGGNFGVATAFEYRLHPVATVYGGLVVHPFPRAMEVLQFYRDFAARAPDEVTVNAVLLTGPDGQPAVGIAGCHCGSLAEGKRVMKPLKSFGPPVMDQMGPIPYGAGLQKMIDGPFGYGMRNYWKSNFLNRLDDALFGALIEAYAGVPSPRSAILIEQGGGAVAAVSPDETAVNFRDAPFNLLIVSMWTDAADDAANRDWARALFEASRPFDAAQAYVNYLGAEADDGGERIKAAYGPDKYARLARLKAHYDPGNLFRLNQNIPPAT